MGIIIPFLSAEEHKKLRKAVEFNEGDVSRVACEIAETRAATQPEFDEIMQAVLRIASEEIQLSTAFEELAELCESSEAPKKDERAGWLCAARLAESKTRVRVGEICKQMTDEKARQSARRKKRKRFDAW